jgi:MraZ protein
MNRFNDKYLHSVDQRGRLQLSRDIRAGFKVKKGDVIHLLPNPGNPPYLSLWTESKWKTYLANLKNQPSSETKRNSLRFIRLMHEQVTADGQGRIVISQRLREFCRFEKEIAIIDMGDYIEAWNKDAVEQKYNDMLRDFNEINDLLF